MGKHMSVSSAGKKAPITVSLTFVQCIACVIVLLLALILRLVGGKPFETLRSLFKQAITDTSVMQITDEAIPLPVGGTNLSLDEPSVTTLPESISTDSVMVQEQASFPVAVGRITSSFGCRTDPFTNEPGFHTGIDIGAPKGTKIMAVYDGLVTRAGTDSSYGKYLVIEHDNGVQTLYAHCSSLHAQKGDNVVAGEVIAKVGSTGNSTGNHLHFELKQNGVYHNPLSILEGHPYD